MGCNCAPAQDQTEPGLDLISCGWTPTPWKNKILLLGTEACRHTSVLRHLLAHGSSPEQPAGDVIHDDHAKVVPWRLETKYYVADLQIWVDQIDSKQTLEEVQQFCEAVGSAIDAIIYVFDKTDEAELGLSIIENWAHFVHEYEPNIALCVAFSSRRTCDLDAPSSETEDWCIANGFEYIDMDLSPAEPDEFGYVEKVGLDRIVEALESNLWDGHRPKGTRPANRPASAVPIDPTELGNDDFGPFVQPNHEVFDGLEEMPTDEDISKVHELLFGGADNDDSFERTLQTLRNFHHSETLDDKDRRAFAAKIALSFGVELDRS
ncbi:uncharacterized protein BJ171DRAFT_517680 [Polychytrium aggregatum]|uniref:uncharacterized protein n=1 Tax=Polychytrium aggregatum TaxID=110093 RepID=UPI0022FEB3DA|nr:uncharacterized protein BJ171DRAFT_517680 [Polychytrium aggregatum]KAI9199760.1 hypothetical protein BJ171DRAFT_517680 [Polychytrium aggregatum]